MENRLSLGFEDILDLLPQNIYWLDKNNLYLGCNKNYLKLLNFDFADQIIGKRNLDLDENLSKESIQCIDQNNKSVIETGENLIFEEEIFLSNGKKIILLSHKIPLFGKDGKILGLLGASIDITDIKNREEVLKNRIEQAELAVENIVANMPGHVYWKDINGVYLGCNNLQARTLNLQYGYEVVGKTDFELPWATKSAQAFRENDLRIMSTGVPEAVEEPIQVNGKKTIVISQKTPIKNKNGNVVGILGISMDITQRKKMEEDLKEAKKKSEAASKAKSEFIANMSHDIRTPITGIVGMIQDLLNVAENAEAALKEKKVSTTEEWSNLVQDLTLHVKNDSDVLMGSVDQLLQLCNEILEVTRLENGVLDQPPESFDIHELVQHNIELLQPVAKNKKLNLTAEIDNDVPKYLKGLRSYADRTLLNLISNALKFTETGYVKVTLTLLETASTYSNADKVTVQISIEDTGIGIPEDKFETIFEHFSRLTPSYEGIYKGSGLGLYTVKRYVEAMNGQIDVSSKVGQGTTFKLTLPFLVADAADKPRRSIRPAKAPSLAQSTQKSFVPEMGEGLEASSCRVLLVEDSSLAAMAVSFVLKRFKCAIDIAENGTKAIEKAQTNSYDLIFMDVGLPDVSGIEVTKAIRSFDDAKKSQVPIVALTGHADNPEMRKECLDAGMQDVLSKPTHELVLEPIFNRFVFNVSEKVNVAETKSQEVAEENEQVIVIDWKGCVHMSEGNEDAARELLSILSDDLVTTLDTLNKLFPTRDAKGLRAELHRTLGGVVYVRLPKLENALKEFQTAVKAEPSDFEEWERAYENLKKVIQKFQMEWKNWKC